MNFVIPIKTVSEANQREHWRTRGERKRKQQDVTIMFCRMNDISERFDEGMAIKLTRLAPKRYPRKLDKDNLAGSFKHVQDAIASEIGIDDGDLLWEYAQDVADEPGVRVELIGGKA